MSPGRKRLPDFLDFFHFNSSPETPYSLRMAAEAEQERFPEHDPKKLFVRVGLVSRTPNGDPECVHRLYTDLDTFEPVLSEANMLRLRGRSQPLTPELAERAEEVAKEAVAWVSEMQARRNK